MPGPALTARQWGQILGEQKREKKQTDGNFWGRKEGSVPEVAGSDSSRWQKAIARCCPKPRSAVASL